MGQAAELNRRYLRLLQLDVQPPTLSYLREIVFRQVCRIPFENVSKLLLRRREGAGRVTTLEEYLEGIERYDLGGTCYTCNPFLAELLRSLGFDADLRGADMSLPDVHTSIRVRVDGRTYHVDAGYGGPFRSPLCVEELPQEIREGEHRYVVDHGPRDGDIVVTHFAGAARLHGYIAHDPERHRDFFRRTILDSFQPGKTFMSCLRIVRIFARHSVELHNGTLVIHRSTGTRTTELTSLAQLRAAVADQLAMPRCPVADAVETLELLTGQSLFDKD